MSPAARPTIIWKLGGSLLDLPDLAVFVQSALESRFGLTPLIIVGGGAAANAVREWDRLHQLGDAAAHDLALQAMALNEGLLEHLLPRARLVRSASQFHAAARDGALPLLCAHCFLKWGESQGHPPLPRSWDVTSDSIAAWVAGILDAEELVLLKSTPLPPSIAVEEAAAAGLVDRHFPQLATAVPQISWVNARAGSPPTIEPWLSRQRAVGRGQ